MVVEFKKWYTKMTIHVFFCISKEFHMEYDIYCAVVQKKYIEKVDIKKGLPLSYVVFYYKDTSSKYSEEKY